jgi:hypothetical protein
MRTNGLILVGLILSTAFASYAHEGGEAAQTDWSGGPGISGPITDWGTNFDSETNISWSKTPGEITLGRTALTDPVEHTVTVGFGTAMSVYADDLDGDKDMDILGGFFYSDEGIVWWANDDGSGASWTEHIIDNDGGQGPAYAEDVDGDGDMDVIARASIYLNWWENDDGSGTSWTEHYVGWDYLLSSVHGADVDGDDDIDILAASGFGGSIFWWSNDDGSGTTWTKYTVGGISNAAAVYAKDVDGDLDMDILGAGDTSIKWWANDDGSGTSWTEHIVCDGIYGRDVYAVDMDDDDDIDVLGLKAATDGIAWWENDDGTGTSWTEHTVTGEFDSPSSVYAGDFDDDGDMDVTGATYWGNAVAWWENDDGYGTSWTEHIIDGEFGGGYSVYAEDVNGDGFKDVLGAAASDMEITWWEVTGLAPSGELVSSIFDTQGSPDWGFIDWTADTPEGTTVKFQLRVSNAWGVMGSWSSDITTHPFSLEGFLEDGLRYVQYKAILGTTEPEISPTLEDITIDWGYTGIGIAAFSAESDVKGIEVSWECADETTGFNLYRSAAGKAKAITSRDKLNAELITGESPYAYLDAAVEKSVTYSYWLEAIDVGGSSETFGPVECTWRGALPTTYALYQSRPNPAAGSATIAFDLPETAAVTLTVYDISGRKVTTVVNETLAAGEHEAGVSGLAPGVYVYKLTAGEYAAAKKMVIQ